MSVKNVLLIALVLVNLLLLSAVVLHMQPPSAQAQVVGGGNNYAVVTARIQASEDALWVLNLRTRKLTAFRMPQGAGKLFTVLDTRDLQKDLRGR